MGSNNTTLYPFLIRFLKLLLVGDPMGVQNFNESYLLTSNLSDLNYMYEEDGNDSISDMLSILDGEGTADADEAIIRRNLASKIVTAFSYILLAICGVIGNTLVIFAILKDPILQIRNQLSNMTIVNLALTDFTTTTVVCIPGAIAVIYDDYPFHDYFCRFCTFANVATIVESILTLSIISVDRFIAVKWPLHYLQWVTEEKMMFACVLTWILAIVCGIGWVIDISWYAFDYDSGICDVRWASIQPNPIAFYYGILCTVFYWAIPTGIIFCLNATIIFLSKDKGRVGILQTADKKKNKGDDSQFNSKILKSMIIVILTYLILNVPVAMIRITKVLGGIYGIASYYPPSFTIFANILQFLASIVNPLIYGLFRKDFKDSYIRIAARLLDTLRTSHE